MWFENQFPYFAWMAVCGAGIMFFYDFLRIHRRLVSCPDFLVNLEDIIFALIAAVAVFYTTYAKNNGEIRWQTAVGLFLGCALYIIIVKDRFVRAVCAVWHIAVKITAKILKIILSPIIFIVKIILRPAKIVFWYSGKGLKTAKTKAKIRFKRMKFIIRKK